MYAGTTLRKVCVRYSGALVVHRFTYANFFEYAIWAGAKNQVCKIEWVCKLRNQIAPSVRKSHPVKSQQNSHTHIKNRVRKSHPARIDIEYETRFAYAILKNPPKSATENRVRKIVVICIRERNSRSLNPWLGMSQNCTFRNPYVKMTKKWF